MKMPTFKQLDQICEELHKRIYIINSNNKFKLKN